MIGSDRHLGWAKRAMFIDCSFPDKIFCRIQWSAVFGLSFTSSFWRIILAVLDIKKTEPSSGRALFGNSQAAGHCQDVNYLKLQPEKCYKKESSASQGIDSLDVAAIRLHF
jgi:hypothetical protein